MQHRIAPTPSTDSATSNGSSSSSLSIDTMNGTTTTITAGAGAPAAAGGRLKKQRMKRKTSPYTRLLWAIGIVAFFIGTVNYVFKEGIMPHGITLTFEYRGGESQYFLGSHVDHNNNNNNKEEDNNNPQHDDDDIGASSRNLAGSHFLPPPRSFLPSGKKKKTSSGFQKNHIHTTTDESRRRRQQQQQQHEDGKFSVVLSENNLHLRVGQSQQLATTSSLLNKAAATTNNDADEAQKRKWMKQMLAKNSQQAQAARVNLDLQLKKKVQQKEREKGKVHNIYYYQELSHREGHDKLPLLKLIRDNAGINFLSEATYNDLPRWSEVKAMYGDKPKLVGLEDQCEKFQQYGDLGDKFLASAGMFNSGTNLLSKMLIKNCVLHKRQEKYGLKNRGIRWQVPYGKHTPPKDAEFRLNHVAQKSEGVDVNNVLPAVMIRDPFRWLQSMCSHHYTSKWPRVFGRKDPRYHCPNLVPTDDERLRLAELRHKPIVEGIAMESETATTADEETTTSDNPLQQGELSNTDENENQDDDTKQQQEEVLGGESSELAAEELRMHYFPVRVKYSNFTRHHRSLVHLWNEWYKEYVDLDDYPHIMVRMEDLLFFPDEVVPKICECAGGRIVTDKTAKPGKKPVIQVVAGSAKSKHSTRYMEEGQEHTGYLDALIKYGSPATRYRGMTPHDLQYAGHYLDKDLMDLFQYDYPEASSTKADTSPEADDSEQ